MKRPDLSSAAAWLALGALVATALRAVVATHRERLAARPAAEPAHLQRWEGEGGAPADPEGEAEAE